MRGSVGAGGAQTRSDVSGPPFAGRLHAVSHRWTLAAETEEGRVWLPAR